MKNILARTHHALAQLKAVIARYSSTAQGTTFFGNSIVQWHLISVGLLNAGLWAALYFFVGPREFLIKFHFNAFFGVETFSQWWAVYVLPAVGLTFFLVNIFVAYWLYFFRERIAAYILLLASLLFHAGIIIGAIAIILVNR